MLGGLYDREFMPNDYEDQIRRNRRWNFGVNVGDLTFFNFALSFTFASTVLPLYASRLTDAAILIGLVPAIENVAAYLPQIIAAHHSEGLDRKKPFIVKVSIWERVPYAFVALGVFLWRGAPDWASYIILILSIAMARGAGGLGSPAWKAMLNKIIHPNRRGLLFGLGWAFGGLFGIGGAAVVRHVLATVPYPRSFGLLFLYCFLAQTISWTFLTLNREPPQHAERSSPTLGHYFRQLPGILRDNPDYTRFLIGQTLVIFGGMGMGFYVIYARKAFGVSEAFAGWLTMAALISQSAGTPVLGWLSDRLGHKWQNQLSTLLGALAALLILGAPSHLWLFAVFVFMNLSVAGLRISRMSITMEFAKGDRVPTYAALASTLLAVPSLLAPVTGGWIVDTWGYKPLFVTALIMSLAGWALMALTVKDPRVR